MTTKSKNKVRVQGVRFTILRFESGASSTFAQLGENIHLPIPIYLKPRSLNSFGSYICPKT